MIICICANISDSTIQKLLNSGLTLEEVVEESQIGAKCGKCLSHLYSHHHTIKVADD